MEITNGAVLNALRCCACEEYLHPPIMLCAVGHSICGHCHNMGVQICPECNSEIGTARNVTLESVISLCKFPCRYTCSGCKVTDGAFKIRDHQEFCEYADIKCPLTGSNRCSWVGKIKDLLQHAQNDHDSIAKPIKNYHRKEMCVYPDTTKEVSIHFGLIDGFSKVFKYGIRFNFRPSTVQLLYMLVDGSPYDAYKYSCITRLIKNSGCNFTSQCHRLMGDQTAFAMTSGNSVYIDKLKEYCISNKYFKIKTVIVLTRDLEAGGVFNENTAIECSNVEKCSKRKRRRVGAHSDTD